MIVSDVIFNDEIDFDADYAVYEYKEGICWQETEPIASTAKDGFSKPLSSILDMEIRCMTIHNNVLIIEASPRINKIEDR